MASFVMSKDLLADFAGQNGKRHRFGGVLGFCSFFIVADRVD
jgi:hypothetical protein